MIHLLTLLTGAFLALPLHADALRYHIEVDPALETVQVRAEFAAPVRSLRARAAAPGDLLMLSACDSDPESRTVSYRGLRRLRLNRAVHCLTYSARLRSVSRGGFEGAGAVMSNLRQWLWLPRIESQQQVKVQLRLPEGMQASVPWKLQDRGYVFGASPGSGDAYALFGRFPTHEIPVSGGSLQVALASSLAASRDWITWQRWLEAAVSDVAAVGGRFPNPHAQVLVVPSGGPSARSPVPFGHVVRDMGESVRFFVENGRSPADFFGDWTGSHEFAHLLLPYVRDKWVSEGFASYYQNVLMARRGAYSDEELWRRLHRSFKQAAAIPEPPTLNGLADAQFWRVRMLVYWSGAAVALLADSQLRERSGGTESLDTVLGRLQRCCLPASEGYSGEAFFALLDAHTDYPIFSGLYEAFAHAPGMPAIDRLFARLGIRVSDGRIRLSDQGPGTEVRRAIETGGPYPK